MKRIDKEGLDELLGIIEAEVKEDIQENVSDPEPKPPAVSQEEDPSKFVDDELKKLLATSNRLLQTAQQIMEAVPDGENVSAASSMVSSVHGIISEFNKTVMMKERYREMAKLEEKKFQDRMKLEEFKATQRQLKLGGNGGINVDKMVVVSQEDLVDKLVEIEKTKELEAPIDVDSQVPDQA